MMLIKNGRVLDPKSGMDQRMDLIISKGKIKRLCRPGEAAEEEREGRFETVIDGEGMIAAPGLIDIHVHFRDPGLTYKEDIHTGAAAAARGGYTTVVCMANTKPVADHVETVEYILKKGKETGIHVLAAAAVSKGLKGQELTNMEELKKHGAVGFTDDGIPLMDEKLVQQAMEEAARLNVPLSFHEEDPKFIQNNGINHGEVSEKLGIFGSPALAEDSLVARDCMIALHTKASVNIQHISSGNSVKMVALAKALGADVTAEVTPHHFTLDEEAVLTHGSLAKMNPPLRTKRDRQMLIEGLKDGTIDIIATDHAPHSREEKSKPLTEAPSGIIGLETALALGITELVKKGRLTILQLLEKMTWNPAKLYRLDKGYLAEGADADLVLFALDEIWIAGDYRSKADNSPFTGRELCGKVKYTICDGKIVYRD
ncbi:dihydroorotase [Lachnospiraceae bacterium 62-35]